MGQVSTITIGANSYPVYSYTASLVADADAYFAAHIQAALWSAKTTLEKQQLLVSSMRMIEREVWSGTAVPPGLTQFPRTGITKCGVAVPDGVPDDIVTGLLEYSLVLLTGGAAELNKSTTAPNIRSVAAGSANVSFFYPAAGSGLRWPLVVNDLLGCYLASAGGTGSGGAGGAGGAGGKPYVSGTCGSHFSPLDSDRSESYL